MASEALMKLGLGFAMFLLVLAGVLLPACCLGVRRRGRSRQRDRRQDESSTLDDSQQQPLHEAEPQPKPGRSTWAGRVSVLAAGSLLSVGLLDMLPDAALRLATPAIPATTYNNSSTGDAASRPRLAYSLALAGLALVLAADCVAASVHNSRAALLAAALSVHSLFEGLALGVEPRVARLAAYFSAVLLHKLAVAASLGVELASSGASWRAFLVSGFAFALASPVGLTLGLLLMTGAATSATSASVFGGALQSAACGTFLYVAFVEILPREFAGYAGDKRANDDEENQEASATTADDRAAKLACLTIGFALVSAYEAVERAILVS